ncbi:hypothetical protein BpHYR1_012127 [Brachionus plicatilis]|uniref:Uncharacterized protein n=1 Tax=Brachionus plicatilis TaxID=10195 RepID=A0A3M7SZI3_BRAPC|nr:hypothetical protein BpHYR1_012127 [Brachionus plicatilis]
MGAEPSPLNWRRESFQSKKSLPNDPARRPCSHGDTLDLDMERGAIDLDKEPLLTHLPYTST